MPDRLLVASYSIACRTEKHRECLGRLPDGRNLLVCPCECHDPGSVIRGLSVSEAMPAAPLPASKRGQILPSGVASALGKRGGKKGGLARAAALTPQRRQDIAREGARARWGRTPRIARKRGGRG